MAISSLQVEKHVLAGILKHPQVFVDVAPWIKETDFYDNIHSTIFLVIKSLFEKGERWDKVLVAEKIKNIGVTFKDDINIYDYIDNLSYIPITPQATQDSTKELVRIRIRRETESMGQEIMNFSRSNGNLSIEEFLAGIDAIFGKRVDIVEQTKQPENLYEGVVEMVEARGNAPVEEVGLKMPYPEFTRMYGGLKTKHVYAFASRPGQGKALHEDTQIPTPTGWKRLKSIQVGDEVFTADGTITKVVATKTWYQRPIYRVITDDEHSVLADESHEWRIQLRSDYDWKIKTTKELFDWTQVSGRKNPKLPIVSPLQLPNRPLPIDPYILGLWLGDGNSSGLVLTSNDDFCIEQWTKFATQHSCYVKPQSKYGHRITCNNSRCKDSPLRKLSQNFRKLGLIFNKHIPVQYLRSSFEQRISLLQGLIDSDGYIASDGQVEFCNTNCRLAHNTLELIHSLGVKASISEEDALLYGRNVGKKYRVRFYYKHSALLPRKALLTKSCKRTCHRYIRIEPYGVGNTICIQIAHPSHLFLCGRAMIPTHNSTLLEDIAIKVSQINDTKAFVCDTEMTTEEIRWRAVAAHSAVPQWYVETGNFRKNKDMLDAVRGTYERLKEYAVKRYVTHYHVADKNLDQVISMIRRWHAVNIKRGQKAIIVYDYLKLAITDNLNDNWKEYQALGAMINRLKRLAEELDCVILTAIQLNRSGEGRGQNAQVDDSSAIAISDRLQWLAAFVGIFRRKTLDEINRDGTRFGTHKLIPLKTRFQGRDAAGHHDLVRRMDEEGETRWVQNFLNFSVTNFDVTEMGSLRDIVEAERHQPNPNDRNPNDARPL